MDLLTTSEPLRPQLLKLYLKLRQLMRRMTEKDARDAGLLAQDIKQALIEWPEIPYDCVQVWDDLDALVDTALCTHVGE